MEFDFDDVIINENELCRNCDYCKNKINEIPLVTFENKCFCDIICAKLFESENNTKITPNFEIYNIYYKNNILSSKSKSLYDLLNTFSFESLPIVHGKIDKNKYITVLRNYIKQI